MDEPNTYRPPTSLAQLSMAEVMETNTGLALAKIWSTISAIFCSPLGIVSMVIVGIVVIILIIVGECIGPKCHPSNYP